MRFIQIVNVQASPLPSRQPHISISPSSHLISTHDPPINRNHLPTNKRAILTQQKRHHARHLLSIPPPLQRPDLLLTKQFRRPRTILNPSHHRRIYNPRRHRIHPDGQRAFLLRRRARQARNSMLAGGIARVALHAHQAGHTARVDDAAAAAAFAPGPHGGELRPQAVEHAAAVDVHDEGEFGVREVPERAELGGDVGADYAGHVGGAGEGPLEVSGCGGDPGGYGGGGCDVDDGGEDGGRWGGGGGGEGGIVFFDEVGGEGAERGFV